MNTALSDGPSWISLGLLAHLSNIFAADLKAMHKVNEAGIITSPRAHINDAAVSAAMSNLPKDSPVLAALTEFQNAANSALSASTDGELNNV